MCVCDTRRHGKTTDISIRSRLKERERERGIQKVRVLAFSFRQYRCLDDANLCHHQIDLHISIRKM